MLSPIIPAKCTRFIEKTLWSEFVYLPSSHATVNISQDISDEPAPKFVTDSLDYVAAHPEIGVYHQYTKSSGQRRLVRILANFFTHLLGLSVRPNEVLVTGGANAALSYAFSGWIDSGEEVIIFEPAYDLYGAQIRFVGGVPVPIPLELPPNSRRSSDYTFDPKYLEKKITKKTKMIVVNNPHNPTGKLFKRAELNIIAKLAEQHNLIVLADEVYGFHIYEKDSKMIRFASLPDMYHRTITIGSAGKALNVTGWKIGWAIGPNYYLTPLRAIHQSVVYTCCTPIQEALGRALEVEYECYCKYPQRSYLRTELVANLQRKRDRLVALFELIKMKPIIPEAGCFMMVDFTALDDDYKKAEYNLGKSNEPSDVLFARWLCRDKKLAVFPGSTFYNDKRRKVSRSMVRACFLKSDELLDKAEAQVREFKLYLDAPF